MLVNYREQRVAPLIAFALFVLTCLIALPLWADRHFPAHDGFAGRTLIAPAMGLFYLFLIWRTLRFNEQVKRDPRALEWDTLGLTLWQNGNSERLQWPQVGDISIQGGRRPGYPSFLKIATRKADGRQRLWRFSSSRLQLSGQPLSKLAERIEHARDGNAIAASASAATVPPDRQAANERYERRLGTARAIVAIVFSVYFVTLAGMAVHLSSNTMLLTPHDALLWNSAKTTFLITAGAILLWYVQTIRSLPVTSWRVSLWFLPKVMMPGLFFAGMMGLWAYLAANVYVTDKTWSGHVEHGTVLMVINEPWITHRGHVNVEAHLIDRPGQDVFFAVDDSDGELLKHWHDPGYIDEPACITVPVQWAGYAIRSELTTDTLLPKGSVSTCK